ncbi:hypothetical protein Trebr_1736 [Treponema brennaborense DSM 12168]|uniref:Uncharacterized protein n=1 Tax=Treponema brennaborense (strain DSM 12168 / CIP 105900 / DD5/3) TaxID=906968 RepID=F4LQE9_TREBD|nr:hypothetical protein Trebr_1736 [Treponema brennaborense DSM 12168]
MIFDSKGKGKKDKGLMQKQKTGKVSTFGTGNRIERERTEDRVTSVNPPSMKIFGRFLENKKESN